MGSITESVGSGRSNVRRFSSIQTRLQRWNNGSSNGDLPPMLPQLQKVRTQVTSFRLQSPNRVDNDHATITNHNVHPCRTPALDLAQQAQLAACNYLGYSPRDLPNDLLHPQGRVSDTHRPLELHMHHFHHHYVASPTSPPFSQTGSQCGGEPPAAAGDNPGAPTTQLALRVGSPVPANTTSTTTVYPSALGLRVPSAVGPQLMQTLQGRVHHVQNSSPSLMNGTSVGDVEAAHRYMQNILWLKNQIDHGPDPAVNRSWKERGGETRVGSERRIMGREPPITSERRPIRRAKKFFPPGDGNGTPDSTSERGVACCRKSQQQKTPSDSALLLEKYEKMRAIRNQNSTSPCHSVVSEDSSGTEDSSGRSGSVPPVKCQRSSGNCMRMRKTKMIENGEKFSTTIASSQQMPKPQVVVRSEDCMVSSPCRPFCRPSARGREPKSRRARSLREDATSSLENDSVCSSGKVSVTRRNTWASSSSSTESDSRQRGGSPPGRPAKKSCGARASRQQAFREARAWETIDRKPRKISANRSDTTRLEASVEPICEYEYELEYEMDSQSKADEKNPEDTDSYVPEEISSLQENCILEEKERGDANGLRAPELRSQIRVHTEIETTKTTAFTEHTGKGWAPSLGSNKGLQNVSIKPDRNFAEDEAKFESIREEPHRCFFPEAIENRAGDYNSSHNKLRKAVEAAWNTNLGTKRGPGDNNYVKVSAGHNCNDLHNSRDQLFRETFPKGNAVSPFPVEGKAHLCEESWKVQSGMPKGIEEDCRNRVPGDPTYRDHENLKALVAREESLQRELKDQTVARVAAEEKGRVAAEQKAHIYEASAKAAEEGLRVLLDERALFHCKFKEELEKGATDRLRLQDLLHLEKLKLEATERELREVRRNFQDSLPLGTKAALPRKTSLQQDPCRLDGGPSVHAVPSVPSHGLDAGNDEENLQLRAESDSRIRAEAKASHFQAAAKAAEKRLRSLLDERNWFYTKFKEELEQNNTDMKKLQHLMELEKSNYRHEDVPLQKKKPDVRSLSAPNVAMKSLDIKTEDGHGARHSEMHHHYKALHFHSKRQQGLHPENQDRHRPEPLSEFKEPAVERLRAYQHRSEAEINEYKQAEECYCGEDRRSVSSEDIYENRDVRYVKASHEKSSMKNDKKRPLSPINGSRALHWKSRERPLSVKVERCKSGREGETTTVPDISPAGSRLDSVDFHFRATLESPDDCLSAAEDAFDFKENVFDRKASARPAVESCAERSHVNGGGPLNMSFPSKWKKETKAELRKMIQEQEMTWKIAEDAVEELGRRLELLERYKMEIQDTLGKTRAVADIDCFFKRLTENMDDFPRGFNSLYNSPIYEEAKSFYNKNCPIITKRKEGLGTGRNRCCQDVCTSPTRPDVSKDHQIERLKGEIAQLRDELRQRETTGAGSPKSKIGSPRSSPSPRPSPPRLSVAVPDWSNHFLSGFETPSLKKEDSSPLPLVSLGNQNTPEVKEEDIESQFHDSTFEELKTITIQAQQNGSMAYSDAKVDKFEHIDVYTSRTIGLEVDDRRWVPIPDDSQDKSAAPTCTGNGICQTERMDYQERSAPQEDLCSSIDLNSDGGELRILKIAVRKLSLIFWEQEEKLKNFKQRETKDAANVSQTEDLRDLYLDMLKELSQQLGELCHELHANTRPDEAIHKDERMLRKCDPLEKIVQTFQHMEMMDSPGPITLSNDVEVAQQLRKDRLESGATESFNGVERKPEDILSESDLRAALRAAEKQIEEQKSTNLLLTEKLEYGSRYLSKLRAEHAEEVARRNQSINYAQQLNFELTADISQTETSLAEIKSRYKTLVSNLEQQLEEARTEAISLQDTVRTFKDEIGGKEDLVSNLEAEAKEQELQIVQLRSQLQTIQDEAKGNAREKTDLAKNLEGMRREVEEQQHRVTELISINEDLIAFSESKEDEIRESTTTIKSLQRCVDEKSAEAAKLSAEALAFSQEVVESRKEGETYRLRCAALKQKVEEIEHELQAREASMERLTQHLGKTIEGQDFILEEKEQLLLSLNRAQYKEHRLDDQMRQSKVIIQDLEDKLNTMDAEINEAKLEMAEMKARGLEAMLIERQAGEMRNRVHALEEEIMEKEGQISILKTSYPGEYTSTF